jgi:glycosyltransferase involved in cell wall biosynthesis
LISLLKSKPDIVVVEHAAKNLETYLIFLLRHLFRFNVIIWGHGKTYASKDSGVGRKMKILLAQHADHFLSYTEGGATYLKSFGIKDGKVTVLNNTFDTLPIAASIKITTEAELIEFAEVNQVSAGKTGLFIGGLDRDKDLDFLLEVSEQIHRIDAEFKLLVIGAGSGAAQVLRAESQGFVVYLDRLSNTEKTIPLLFASFFMIPRGIGLVAVDALLSGIPILSIRDNLHGPEHEYLIEGKSVHYASSKDSYLKLCLEFLGHSTSLMERQNLNIEELKELSIEKMVDNFISGLSKTQK